MELIAGFFFSVLWGGIKWLSIGLFYMVCGAAVLAGPAWLLMYFPEKRLSEKYERHQGRIQLTYDVIFGAAIVIGALIGFITVLKIHALPTPPLPVENVKTELRRYVLLDWDPPKHFYVTLKDVTTGQLYERTYVSKHCNAHTALKRGEEYNISVTTRKQGESTWLVFNDLSAVFC